MNEPYQIHNGDCLTVLREMDAESVQCVVTSPPYWGLRDYGVDGQLGLEATPEEYTAKMVEIFREIRRVLRSDGTLWLNLGDSYTSGNRPDRDKSLVSKTSGLTNRSCGLDRPKTPAGLKPKDLIGILWRIAFALQADGWYLRSDIIWSKPNPMPESVTDRPTKAHEYIFLMSKNQRYFYDAEAVEEQATTPINSTAKQAFGSDKKLNDGAKAHTNRHGKAYRDERKDTRSRRTVWEITTQPYPEAHFATYPEKLIEPCIEAGCPAGGTVLDPFCGSGTTGVVALKLNRQFIGIELKPEYAEMAHRRIRNNVGELALMMMEPGGAE